jgi:hypothetical protein
MSWSGRDDRAVRRGSVPTVCHLRRPQDFGPNLDHLAHVMNGRSRGIASACRRGEWCVAGGRCGASRPGARGDRGEERSVGAGRSRLVARRPRGKRHVEPGVPASPRRPLAGPPPGTRRWLLGRPVTGRSPRRVRARDPRGRPPLAEDRGPGREVERIDRREPARARMAPRAGRGPSRPPGGHQGGGRT